jgi:hypothetical protein
MMNEFKTALRFVLTPLHLLPGVALTLAIFVTGACAPKLISDTHGEYSIESNGDGFGDLLARASAECPVTSESGCPSSVGLVLSKQMINGKESFDQCTGVLLSESIFVTNSHCVDRSLRHAGASCSQWLAAVFPANDNYPAQKIMCSQILSASEPDADTTRNLMPDYVVMRLAKPAGRSVMKVSREGLPDRLSLKAYVFDPKSHQNAIGSMNVRSCTVKQPDLSAAGLSSPVVQADDCRLIEGNSGGPMVDAKNQLRAINHAHFVGNVASAYITNFMCTPLPSQTGAPARPASCPAAGAVSDSPASPAQSNSLSTLSGELPPPIVSAAARAPQLEDFRTTFNSWKARNLQNFDFDLVVRGDAGANGELSATPEIICVRLRSADSELSQSVNAVQIPIWTITPGATSARPKVSDLLSVEASYNPAILSRDHAGKVDVKSTLKTTGEVFNDNVKIDVCN